MKQIIIYAEGGGPPSFVNMGRAFETFFLKVLPKRVKVAGKEQDIKQVLQVIACGGDGDARNFFRDAPLDPDIFKVLLVDSDGDFTVTQDCRDYLANKKNWSDMTNFDKEQIHLMVQMVKLGF